MTDAGQLFPDLQSKAEMTRYKELTPAPRRSTRSIPAQIGQYRIKANFLVTLKCIKWKLEL